MPALPSSILEPLWVQVAALLPTCSVHHPLGCHRPRIADHTCSATTLRRRRDEWVTLGVAEQLRRAVLAAYDRLFSLELEHLAVDGCITKAPCGGEVAGPSPTDRRKRGLERSVATEAGGIPHRYPPLCVAVAARVLCALTELRDRRGSFACPSGRVPDQPVHGGGQQRAAVGGA